MTFMDAMRVIFDNEGGYSNNPLDPGGETKFGISKRSYPNVDIKNMTLDKAAVIYKRDYWDKINGDALPYPVALVAFDIGVNAGIHEAAILLQKSVDVVQDGNIGPKTINAVKNHDIIELINEFSTLRMLYYISLANFKIFGKGWTKRSFDTHTEAVKHVWN